MACGWLYVSECICVLLDGWMDGESCVALWIAQVISNELRCLYKNIKYEYEFQRLGMREYWCM